VGENQACRALEEVSDGEATCCRNDRPARPFMHADRVHHDRAIQRRSSGDLEQVRPSKGGVDVDVHAAGGRLHEVARQRGCADRADAADVQRAGVLKHAATQVENRRRGDDPAWQVGDDISRSI
jgi:hypothetical protein